MKKKIGILLRCDDAYHLNKELTKVLIDYNVIPIGIVSDKLEDMIEISKNIDGYILQGGSDYTDIEIEFVKYLYDNNIRTLGICLGMQMMGIMKDGIMGTLETNRHKSPDKYVHQVILNKDSKLYEIVKEEKFLVNSRHQDYIKTTRLDISAKSDDGIIEAVEDKNKTFFIGVQWHPESIMDDRSKKIFESFLNSISI